MEFTTFGGCNTDQKDSRVSEQLRQTLARYHQTYVSAVENTFGDPGIKALKKAFKKLGLEIGEDLRRKGQIKEKGVKGFLNYLSDLSTITGFEFEILESDDGKKILRTTHCPYEVVWKKMKATRKVCEVLTKVDEGMAEAFCGKRVILRLTGNLLEGDPYCDYVFEEK